MQRTAQTRDRNLSSTERVDSDQGGQRAFGAGLTCSGVQGVSIPRHSPQHIPCVDSFVSLNPPHPGQDSEDSGILLVPSCISGASSVFTMHMCTQELACVERRQWPRTDRAGQLGHACVLRIAERCGKMVFIKGSFCYNRRNPTKVSKQEISNSRHSHSCYELLL